MSEAKLMLSGPVKTVSLGDLIPFPGNSKIHSEEQIEALAENIRLFGFDQPIVVDKNMVIIKGHGRRLAALRLEMKKVQVIVAEHLTEDQVKAARIADNQVISQDFDQKMLVDEIRGLDDAATLLSHAVDEKTLAFATDEVTLKVDVFVEDVNKAVEQQRSENEQKAKEADGTVPIVAILGFKSVSADQERDARRAMMHIEAVTGKEGAEAFAEYGRYVMARTSANAA